VVRFAVTGATGRIGGRVAELLSASGRGEVRELSSRNAPYDDPAALRSAFSGVDTVVLVSSDGEAARVVVHHRTVLEAATHCGVRHLVFLSGLDVAPQSPFCYAHSNGDTERLLVGGETGFSILRASLYGEFLLGLVRRAAAGRTDGVAPLPAGEAVVSAVAREDVARGLAALALTDPTRSHHRCTGPEALSFADIATAAGHRYVDTAPELFATALTMTGEEPWWVYAYGSLFASIRQGRWAEVSEDVEFLTGRAACTLDRAAAAVTGAPDPVAKLGALRVIGRVVSSLTDPHSAPKQADSAPSAWLVLDPAVLEGLTDIRVGDELLVLTWLHRADREVLRVHPQDRTELPLRGVFSTRSADRPNPVGLHPVRVVAVDGPRVQVDRMEAVDGTPVLDLKPVLGPR
jgi:NAD(P)H dehydrogenase (quinone)